MKTFARYKAILALSLLAGATMGRAQQMMLTGDTQLNSGAPTSTFGTSPSLTVSSTTSALVKFDLADILPSGITASQAVRARLIVYVDSVTTGGTVNAYEVTSSWSENSVTYNTRPSAATTLAGQGTAATASAYIDIPLSGLVQAWIAKPNSNYGVELKPSGSTHFSFNSKENTTTSHPPVLIVDLAGPDGATGPAGPKGATGPAGPKGATGAQGPAGGLNLPYAGYVVESGYPAFEIQNQGTTASSGTPDGIEGIGGTSSPSINGSYGGNGVTGYGGVGANTTADVNDYGGSGIAGYGGNGNASGGNYTTGGSGGAFIGGTSGGSSVGHGGEGVVAQGGGPDGVGIVAYPANSNSGFAGVFDGAVQVNGTLYNSSEVSRIDHPLDPENKYLVQSSVQSSEMKNVYDGVVVTDGSGTAVVNLPDWFESLNRDFRYQLTPIGQFTQAIVASEISNNRFVIRTDKGGVKVSWQVTGIRQDAWANAHRLPIEMDKTEQEKGRYIHPELFGHAGEPDLSEVAHPKPSSKLALQQ